MPGHRCATNTGKLKKVFKHTCTTTIHVPDRGGVQIDEAVAFLKTLEGTIVHY